VESCDIVDDKWNPVANGYARYSSKLMSLLTQHIEPVLTTSERFASLPNLSGPLTITRKNHVK
jgi:hypothetical protein